MLIHFPGGAQCDLRSLCGDEAISDRICASSELLWSINAIASDATHDIPKAAEKS